MNIEFIVMCAATVAVIVFMIMPAVMGIVFDYTPTKYMDSVKAGICVLAGLVLIAVVSLVVILVITFVSGDPQPITTLLERIAESRS